MEMVNECFIVLTIPWVDDWFGLSGSLGHFQQLGNIRTKWDLEPKSHSLSLQLVPVGLHCKDSIDWLQFNPYAAGG